MELWKKMIPPAGQNMAPRTLAELWGTERLLVEHHRGILRYGEDEILVKTTYGYLLVEGVGLRLGCMSRERLVICGKIQQILPEEGP